MSKVNKELLTNITAKHDQFCNGLKALTDVVEELCNQSENIHQLSNRD
jgi:hypothetical protein